MNTQTFIDKLSAQIKQDFPESLNNVVIVLPNKRARVFLLENLKKYYQHSVFAPEIISIEELIQKVSGVRSLDSIEVLFEFYIVYREIAGVGAQDFDKFANWATMLLQDFNEIDRYLLEPNKVFSYLKDIEDIKHWSLDMEKRTSLIENYLEFWNMMPVYYKQLYERLSQKKVGYQGLVYREAVKRHKEYVLENGKSFFYFAGFNALNAAEEVIIQYFLFEKRAKVLWDMDEFFLNDPYHDAGYFLRRIKKKWPHYQNNPFEWIVNEYSQEKNIKIIQTPKLVGQAKITGQILEQVLDKQERLDRVAVVLGDENLLLPVLYALPDEVSSLNITMGYSGKSNPVQLLLNKIFKMHLSAIRRGGKSDTVYYKEVLDVLGNPVLANFIEADAIVKEIHKRNWTFFNADRLSEWYNDSNYPLRALVFESWREKSVVEILETLLVVVLGVKACLTDVTKEERLVKTFLYASYNLLNRLVSYCTKYTFIESIEMLYQLYRQVMDMSEVSFEGEPLEGLQIMGVLESRVLDFDTVIVTSVNESKFPSGKAQNSFIPYDVKRELGLPTFKEKDAIYSFHFYHLMLRAKNVYLIYNSQSEGMDAGEKSRFLTQLEIEKRPKHQVEQLVYSAFLPDKAYQPIEISKSVVLQNELKRIATETRGFSPSSLSNYLRNPLQFYLQRILGVKEVDEVEESIALNTLGTIIHNSLEELYTPFVGARLEVEHIELLLKKANAAVERQFETVYNNDKEKMGKNLLGFEVAKRNVFHFLNEELQSLKKGEEIEILALETELKYELVDELLPYPVRIFGYVDRIERRNGVLRVIDYKSGKVESRNVRLSEWEGFALELKNDKIIQLLCYALMYYDQGGQQPLEAGIYSFKNRKEGFLFFGIKDESGYNSMIDREVLDLFRTELIQLLLVILNPEESFIENI